MHRICGSVTFSTAQPEVVTVGIDFGCKNSRVAIINSLAPQVVDAETGPFVPSYVTLTPQNSFLPYKWGLQQLDSVDVGKYAAVGELAKRKMWIEPSNVIYSIKKLIGGQFNDPCVQEMRKNVHFSIIEGQDGEALVKIDGIEFSPVEITSVIFSKLKDIALMQKSHHELQVVISVPAFFNKQQKEDIKSAGHSAGLKIMKLIDEPVAAALSGMTIQNGTVVVFTMGARSYSVTILHVSPDTNIEIITQFNNTNVGGDQFDNILVDHFVAQIFKLHSVDVRENKYAMMMLAEAAEQAKVALSNQSEFTVSFNAFLPISAQCPVDLNITLSRIEFEKLVDKLIREVKVKCQNILKDAKMSVKDIDEVILAGGMARVPKIRSIISEVFGKCQSTTVKPEEAVVMGSAIQAALIVEDEQEITEDMLPLSIGLKSAEGFFTRVIPRHTIVPTKRTVKISGWCAYGECKHVGIYFGEHFMVDHNVCLGEIELINNQNLNHSSVDFEMTLEVDKDYVVKVSARNADDLVESADYGRKPFQAFKIKEVYRCKEEVKKAVKKAVLGWPKYSREIDGSFRNMARHTINALDDLLYFRKDELPKDLCEDAMNALTDLRKSLHGDILLLKEKILSAKFVQSMIMHWKPESGSLDSDS
ncbi:hypothetical protein ACP70R_050217 [Stipagrostis hirtigluma subsp. patula]